jgi:NADPH2:quinone reductase
MTIAAMRAVRFSRVGGPEVLRVDDVPLPEPGAGEVRIRVRHAGVNFIDTYLRAGSYDPGPLPAGVGKEGAGRVEAVGSGVETFAPGDRVAFFDARGAYADAVVISAERAIPVPAELDDTQAAALPLQGMTARYLTHEIRPLGKGDTVLIHAAAGGVGHLAVQLAKLAGAAVLATCSTDEKATRVREIGADHVIRYDQVDFADEVLRITGDRGVDVAIDGVGKATFVDTVRATRARPRDLLRAVERPAGPDPAPPFARQPHADDRLVVRLRADPGRDAGVGSAAAGGGGGGIDPGLDRSRTPARGSRPCAQVARGPAHDGKAPARAVTPAAPAARPFPGYPPRSSAG